MATPRIHPKTLQSLATGGSKGLGGGQFTPHFLVMRDSRIIPYADAIWKQSGEDPDTYVEKVFEFVTKNVGYAYDADMYGLEEYVAMPYEALINGWGDCDCSSILMVSMLTAMGIPSHMSLGYAGSGSHRWPEVKYKGDWWVFDTSNGDVFPTDKRLDKGYSALFYVTPHSFRPTAFPIPLFLP